MLHLIMLIFCGAASAASSDDLIGKWQATGYIYQGTFIQPPDPQLTITFEFFADGTDTLFWKKNKEEGFCERTGKWYVVDDVFHDEIIATNPANHWDCSGDPDMEIGRKNESKFWVEDGNLHTVIPLGDEELIYVWLPITPSL